MPTCFRLVSLLICWESDQKLNFLWGFSGMWGFGKVWLWSSVSVFNSLAIRQLSKKASQSCILRFRPKVPNQTKLVVGGKLWGGLCLCLGWSHYWGVLSDVLYDEYLSAVIGCVIYAKSMSHQQCEKSDIFATSIFETPLNDLCSWGGLHSSLLVQLCF